MTRIIEVIETYEKRGRGTMEDPVRKVYQLWTKEGKLIFENDPDGKVTREPEYPPQQQDEITSAQNRLVLTLQNEGYIDQNLQSETLSKKDAHELISAALKQKNIVEAHNSLQTKSKSTDSGSTTQTETENSFEKNKTEGNNQEELNDDDLPDY